jgi:2-polyprenyl-3-methyl-5-hydroxy-6-metoxy-1,4-benzoquinol methylase
MIDKPEEYQMMFDAEDNHWWYRALQHKCLIAMREQRVLKEASILDAGCGTGGMLGFLKNRGYRNLQGFDISEKAIEYCKVRQLDCIKAGIFELKNAFIKGYFEVIICADVLYFFEDKRKPLEVLRGLMKSNGIIIINMPALSLFSGSHDAAVGIRKRITKRELIRDVENSGFKVLKASYWPFVLSPAVYVVRKYRTLKSRGNSPRSAKSDLEFSPGIVNSLLYYICNLESNLLSGVPTIGSSVFLIAKAIETKQ